MLYIASRTRVTFKRTFSLNTILRYGRVLERVHQGSPAVRALKINFVAPSCTDVGSIRATGRQSFSRSAWQLWETRSCPYTATTPRNQRQQLLGTHQKWWKIDRVSKKFGRVDTVDGTSPPLFDSSLTWEETLGSVKSGDTLSRVAGEHNTQIPQALYHERMTPRSAANRDVMRCDARALAFDVTETKWKTWDVGTTTPRIGDGQRVLSHWTRARDWAHATRVGRSRRRRRSRKPTEARTPLQTSNFDRRVLATRGWA